MSERGIVQKVNENALSLNLFLPLPSAFPAPFRSPILINKYANANCCCCCCRFYPLATFRTMRFGIAIPGCIALCRPISSFSQIIDSGSTFGIDIRHFPYLKFEIWIFKLQAASLHIRSCPLPRAPTPVQLSVAIASMRPTYFAYGLTPRNPFPSALSGPIQFSISLHLSPMFETFRFGIWFRVDLGLIRLYSEFG